jgi:hypothetical protein
MESKDLNEQLLPDDYPVYGNYLYVVDGKVIMCDLVMGTVADLKRDLRNHYKMKAENVWTCDIDGRRKLRELDSL